MKVLIVMVALMLTTTLPAQNTPSKPTTQSQPAVKTFTSPDGVFQFSYSDTLIVCQKQSGGGGNSWVPAKNCSAYHPVCDAETPEKYTGIACLAYPKNKLTDTQAFEAATFSVEILDGIASVEKCQALPDNGLFQQHAPITIQGVSFAAFEFGEGGMNQSVSGMVYRAFHAGKCYQLGIDAATANADVFDPPARELTKEDWQEINGRLEQARDSFRFLK